MKSSSTRASDTYVRTRFLFGLILTAAMLGGCGGSMTLDTPTFPQPLVKTLPMHVGLRISPEMYAFSHEEEVLGRETWKVDMGEANAKMFEQLFGHMFNRVTLIDEAADATDIGLDALVETSIDAFEFSVPEQTQNNAYSIWIRYRLKVYDDEGEMIANWPVSAYGRSESGGLGSGDDSLEKAAILAMRDAAALMILRFDKETGIGALQPAPVSAEAPIDENTSDTTTTAAADDAA